MKKNLRFAFYLGFIGISFFSVCLSCNIDDAENKNAILAKIERDTKSSDSLLKEFGTAIQGVWNSEADLNRIAKGDVKLVESAGSHISVMNIDTESIIGNRLNVGVGYSDGHGADITIFFKPGKLGHTLATDTRYELGCNKLENYTTLYLYYREGSETKNIKFIKMANSFPKFH